MSNMVVRTNVFSLNAHRNMKNTGLEMGRASNRLSSGFRINSAADDAAGLAISETMRAQIRGLDQASRNAQDGQAMLLTTEGGLEEIGNMLQRTRELLVQASNDTNTQNNRAMIEQEIAQLGQEIQGMQERVEFNTNQVLNIGAHSTIATAIATAQGNFATAAATMGNASAARAIAVANADVARDGAIATAEAALETALELANTQLIADLGSADTAVRAAATAVNAAAVSTAQGAFNEAAATANQTHATAVEGAENTFRDAGDVFQIARNQFLGAVESQLFVRSTTGNGVAWFQVGANANQGIEFDFETVSQAVLVSGQLVSGIADALVSAGTNGMAGVGFGEDISPMINAVDGALESINAVRANLGAVQNRMDFTMRSLDLSSENLQDSESRVRNADMAREMMRFTMSQVLSQAATAMLSQANQIPNNLLQILR